MWCTILNGSLLILSFLLCTRGTDWVFKMHSMWYEIPRDTFNAMLYGFLGVYKMLWFIFNVIPYVALVIMT
jgi:hypothetical protein